MKQRSKSGQKNICNVVFVYLYGGIFFGVDLYLFLGEKIHFKFVFARKSAFFDQKFKKNFFCVFWLRKATLIFADFLVRKCAWEKFKFKNSTLCHFGRTVHSGGLKNGG